MPSIRTILLLSVLVAPSHASAQTLICFGNEPSWGVDLTAPGVAQLTMMSEAPATYKGKGTTLDFLRETMWRGSAAGGDLVVFMRDMACSDGMSDTEHPVAARVSLPDGRFLAGCCRVPPGATTQSALEGVSWQLTGMTGLAPAALAGGATPISARFENGRVSGFSGCNRFTGGFTTGEGRLTIGQLAGTMMACAEPAMALEKAFKNAFTGTLRYAVSGSQLTLTADSGTVLSFEKDAGRLDGVNWVVTGFNNGRGGVVSPAVGTRLTLTFADGVVSGSSGCNTFQAGYVAEGARITFKPATSTRKACTDELMAQEREFLAALESTVTFSVEGGTLDMHREDGERTIHATSVPQQAVMRGPRPGRTGAR